MEVKEAPVRGVRAVVGRLFGGKKARAKAETPAAPAPEVSHVKVIDADAPEAEAVATDAAPEMAVSESEAPKAEAEETATQEDSAAPETVTTDAETPAAGEATTPEATGAEATDATLPLANYDTLTVASLRARLRSLSVDDLVVLINYEKAHEGREEVVGMFERRKAKIIAGETSSFQAVK
jgi:hypothetical protein